MSSSARAEPPPSDFAMFASAWRTDGIRRLLGYVWAGYDALRAENPSTLNPMDELNLNSHLESWINRKKPQNCPFDIQHTPPELSTRLDSSRPAPAPDFGFFPWSDRRSMFPLEAKVLRTDGELSQYVKALRTRYLECRYAPFCSEGVMIAYLITGVPEQVFTKLGVRLKTPLAQYASFSARPHRVSEHVRKHKRCKPCPKNFSCHHLIFAFFS
jgi:hypothetical protein